MVAAEGGGVKVFSGFGYPGEDEVIPKYGGGILILAKGQAPGQGAWCVAKPSATDDELQQNINFACNFVNCNVIQPGGACYDPQTLSNHASWKSALIAVIDPSYGDCKCYFVALNETRYVPRDRNQDKMRDVPCRHELHPPQARIHCIASMEVV
ncbi:hypothetical protein OSB04_013004, partial [Centaurea solstitialis]